MRPSSAWREYIIMVITEKEFVELTNYIKLQYGIHMKEEKRTLLIGRLQQVLQQNNFASFTEFLDHVKSDKTGHALVDLADKITTNHTFFMRETNHFQFFQAHVLPELTGRLKEKDLRIWSAGCSSGQEPYTLVMILSDYFGKDKMWWNSQVLATDISTRSLQTASAGEYPIEQIETLPANWRDNYTKVKTATTSVISDKLKSEVIYRKFNLMEPVFPFKKKFHVIFCRNVMIYFDNPTKEALVDKFWDQLEYGGYLFIGHAESLNRERTKFRYVMPALYRKE